MLRRPPRSTRTDTLFPYTTLCRAGDRATDYNLYTKRALLAGGYSSTLLYWLNDRSEGFAATWAFLDRRIGEVLKVAGQLGKGVGTALSLPERLVATITQARQGKAWRGRGSLRGARR